MDNTSAIKENASDSHEKILKIWFVSTIKDADCNNIEKEIRNIKSDSIISWKNFRFSLRALGAYEISISSIFYQTDYINSELDQICDQINEIEGVAYVIYVNQAPI